ncbi:MAG: efflux RND transporter periplasmic adaptor subunit [Planctomycetes bacterium]|nr:efflux RND transporter periplasmic adaptor subunit [Planctomycetota bacterium]
MRKLLVITLFGGLLGWIGYKYVTTDIQDAKRGKTVRSVVAVETVRVKQADLGDRVVFTGSIKAEERYDAAPKVAGIIRQVNFNVGDTVNRGAVLAVLDDDELRLEVEQAEASLRVAVANANDAESQLEIARRDFIRAENLHKSLVISAQEYDRYDATLKGQEAKYETTLAEVKLAEALLKTAKVKLGYTRVMAEWTEGPEVRVIGQRFMDAGALALTTTPILSVLDIRTVRAVLSVSEKEYPKMALGDTVRVSTDAFPGRVFTGTISRIPQELGVLTREAEVEVAIDNPDLVLKPGMFVRADIEFQRRYGAAAAPLEAVVRREDGSRGVYVVNDDRTQVSFCPVVEGIVDGRWVELVDGGDLLDREVVVLGQHLLRDGISIRVSEEA